jgi:hypothetical protein
MKYQVDFLGEDEVVALGMVDRMDVLGIIITRKFGSKAGFQVEIYPIASIPSAITRITKFCGGCCFEKMPYETAFLLRLFPQALPSISHIVPFIFKNYGSLYTFTSSKLGNYKTELLVISMTITSSVRT